MTAIQKSLKSSPQMKILLVASLLAAIALFNQVLCQPVVGLADNGDFERIMSDFGITHRYEAYSERHEFMNRLFSISTSRQAPSGYLSSAKPFVGLAAWLNALLRQDGLLDVRLLGALHGGLYWAVLFALLLLFRDRRPFEQAVLSAGILLASTDVGYVQYFNSFYSEPIALIAFLLVIALSGYQIRTEGSLNRKLLLAVGIAAASLLMATSKQAFAPLGFLLGFWNLRLLTLERLRPRLQGSVGVLLLLLVLSVSTFYFINSVPGYINYANRFNAIFSGVLSTSQNTEQDLKELGLQHPEHLSRFAGRNYWQTNIQTIVRENPSVIDDLNRVSYPDLLRFYALHPERFIQLVLLAGERAFELRLPQLSNFEVSSGEPPLSQSQRFAFWSSLRRALFPRSSLTFIAFFVGNSLSVLLARRALFPGGKGRLVPELHLFCLLAALVAFAVAVIGEGLIDLTKHLFLFNLAVDTSLLLLLYYLLVAFQALLSRGRTRPGLYSAHA